ncbi:Hypothetical protein NocV09_00900950 [Nannochloropsis oceanica]
MGKYKSKHRVRVVLSDLKEPEFSLGALLGHSNSTGDDARKKKKKKNKPSPLSDDEESFNDPRGIGNFIKMLETKYCGHAGMRSGQGGEEGGSKKRAHKHDLYDLDDDIIDDSALHEVFEKQHEAQSVLTKYSGFFVNRGNLDVVGRKEGGEEGGKKKRGRKSGGEGGRKKPKGNDSGRGVGGVTAGGEDTKNGGGVGGDGGENEGKAKKIKKLQKQHQQKVGGGEVGDDMSVVSNSNSSMAFGGGGGGGSVGSNASSSNNITTKNKAKGAEMQAVALVTFQDAVKKWREEQQQSSSPDPAAAAEAAAGAVTEGVAGTAAGATAGVAAGAGLDELPLALRPAALAFDLVMRRPAGEKKYKSTHPGDNGLSPLYIDKLQALLLLGGKGREGGRAWRKGLAEAAVGRVRVLNGLMEECLVGFRRQYEVKLERLTKRACSNSNSSSSKMERGEEGMEGQQDEAMPPPKSVALDMKLKQCLYTLLTSLKERSSIQVLFAGRGLEGGAEGEEAEGLLPLVPVKHEEEERKVLTTLAMMWPEEGMKIPRLRRAFNDYKGRQQLLQSVNGADAAGGGGKGGGSDEAGALVQKKAQPKENGITVSAHAKLKKTSPTTMATTKTTKKTQNKVVTVATKQRAGPCKGSFQGLQRIPFNAADFEQEARND